MDSLKEFQQKIKNRKFAIDHSWKVDESGWSNSNLAAQDLTSEPLQDLPWEQLNENLAEADTCKYFSGYWPLVSDRRLIGKWIVFAKKVMRKLLKIFFGWYIFPHYQRMSHFNGKVINAITLERDILNAIVQQTQAISQKINVEKEEAVAYLEDIQRQIEQLRLENEQLRTQLKKIENLPTDDEDFYHAFEEKFRGSEELIRDRLRVYISVIRQHIPDWAQGRFIDVGSGRGEWLDILRENGAVDYVGVDLNARQNTLCEARGHHVVQMDCIEYLAAQPENSVDLVSGFQIIEHLCMSDFIELLRQSYRVLKPGGMIIFETQNPRNIIVGANTFYIDPSHKRPLDPRMVSFIVEWCGYSDVKCIDANSNPYSAKTVIPEWNKNANAAQLLQEFNDIKWLLYGPQDYAVIGVKEG